MRFIKTTHSVQRLQSTASPLLQEAVLRRGQSNDLAGLVGLEKTCFEPCVRESPGTIRRSLSSHHQEVWILELRGRIAGAVFLRQHPLALRVYSLAVSPEMQGRGFGRQLMQLAEERAMALGKSCLILEVRAKDEKVHSWYRNLGYTDSKLLPGYYSEAGDGWKMVKFLNKQKRTPSCR